MSFSSKALLSTFLLFVLTACGGGGSVDRAPVTPGNPGTPTTPGGGSSPTVTVTLEITDATGQNNNQLDASTPLTISALVSDSDGNVLSDELVTFSFSIDGLATFNNDSGTGLTDVNGVAEIGLEVGPNSGDGLVTASIETADGVISGQIGFSSAGIAPVVETPATVEFLASAIQLASSGSDEIELIAVVKNEQNILMEGVDVTFSANNDAELRITQGTTAADGTARAVLTSRSNPAKRTITATAQAAGLSEVFTLSIDVVGTVVNISGPSSVIINDPVPLTIIVADSDGQAIPDQDVVMEVIQGEGIIDNPQPETGPTGQVTVLFTAASSGTVRITASSLGVTSSPAFELTVQQDQFSFTTLPEDAVELGDAQTVGVTWLKEGVPFEGGTVTFTSSRGEIVAPTVVTDANGVASVTISSADAGIAAVSAVGVDTDANVVTARSQITFIATEPATIIADATPDSIGPDGQTATITAVVRDVSGNLVTGQTVNFRVEDVSGGFVSPNSAITDSNGIASTIYTSNVVSSLDSIGVTAEVADDPAIADTTFLTVGDRAFDISLGTGREVQAPDDSSYLKEFSVFVTDPNSNPVDNVQLSISGTPVKFSNGGVYFKGFWEWDPIAEVYFTNVTAVCQNEDINANGILDAGEDTNGDGVLTPGNVAAVPSNLTTDVNGQAVIEVRYPKQFGGWAVIALRVSGQSSGSEAVQNQNFRLVASAEDTTDEASPPPPNPFGQAASCDIPD